ncbi:response regulator [Streptomyces sp. URMC 127]|uniref:response regulator n=1 Tax=Streptomyces sp. URMC 127 TaxID=3423402 RepID=UPI003F1D4EE3
MATGLNLIVRTMNRMTGRDGVFTVLVVDSQGLTRAGIAALLQGAPDITAIHEAADGSEAVRQAARVRPHLVLIDIDLPVMDGLTAAGHILAQADAPPKVLVLTTHDTDEYVYSALRAGVSGFLLKDIEPQRLLSAVSSVMAGDMLFAPSIIQRLIASYVPGTRSAGSRRRELARLSVREAEVLSMVGRGLENADIAMQLVVSESTVKTHLYRVMTKLGLRTRAQAVVFAYESGLIAAQERPSGQSPGSPSAPAIGTSTSLLLPRGRTSRCPGCSPASGEQAMAITRAV